jgi:hypothetical protein
MSNSLSTSWLGARLGRDPHSLERLRRSGEILGVRTNGHYTFPAWQFDGQGRIVEGMPRVIATARTYGVSDERLGQLLQMRVGLASTRRLADELRDGNVDHVLAVVRQAGQAAA